MSEQELKLNVPRNRQAAVEAAMRRGAVKKIQLRARYFDTPARDLVKAGIALRLRLEGEQWVQTLKMPGEHALERIELNHPALTPELDISVYKSLPVYKKLRKLHTQLAARYETDILRTYRSVRTPTGIVEVSFDRGNIIAGELTLPVSEVEFELVSGELQSIFMLGLKWQTQHNLILDLRSKAERGDALAVLAQQLRALENRKDAAADEERTRHISNFWAPYPVAPIELKQDMSCAEALNTVMQACLEQIARNSAILAEVDTAGIYPAATPEHTHQLRIGLRRLRSAWSLFEPLTCLPPQTWREDIKIHFAGLGAARDEDVMRDIVMPVLTAAGLPPIEFTTQSVDVSATDVVCSKAFQTWQIQLLAWAVNAHPVQIPVPDTTPTLAVRPIALKTQLRRRLYKWGRQILRDGLVFDTLAVETKHDLRKRVKRLRYGLQFADSLLSGKKQNKYRKQLSQIQDILGSVSDLHLARDQFEVICRTQPEAWFAMGWIASQLEALDAQAKQAFESLPAISKV